MDNGPRTTNHEQFLFFCAKDIPRPRRVLRCPFDRAHERVNWSTHGAVESDGEEAGGRGED